MLGTEITGNQGRHLNVLVGFICGIIKSGQVKLPEVAGDIPKAGKTESHIMQLRRWLKNEAIGVEFYYLPFIKPLLQALSKQTLVLIIDGSTTGRGCVTLMVSVLYKNRSLPLPWLTRTGKKGHFPESLHIELIQAVQALIPSGADVVCLGDTQRAQAVSLMGRNG